MSLRYGCLCEIVGDARDEVDACEQDRNQLSELGNGGKHENSHCSCVHGNTTYAESRNASNRTIAASEIICEGNRGQRQHSRSDQLLLTLT